MVEVYASQTRVVCRGPRLSRSQGELTRDGVFSCEAETCHNIINIQIRTPKGLIITNQSSCHNEVVQSFETAELN
jgi:hypothetical protein